MKVTIIAATKRSDLETTLSMFVDDDVTVHGLAYAIGPKGEREVVVLYSEGSVPEVPAAVRSWLAGVLADRKAS